MDSVCEALLEAYRRCLEALKAILQAARESWIHKDAAVMLDLMPEAFRVHQAAYNINRLYIKRKFGEDALRKLDLLIAELTEKCMEE